jgi:hypothetical protein
MLFSTLAATQPISRPVAVNVTGVVTFDTVSDDVENPSTVILGGRESITAGGTVKVPAAVGASQVNSPTTKELWLPASPPYERPVILT